MSRYEICGKQLQQLDIQELSSSIGDGVGRKNVWEGVRVGSTVPVQGITGRVLSHAKGGTGLMNGFSCQDFSQLCGQSRQREGLLEQHRVGR